jgi:Flp pilus assembly protein CpaB
LFLCFEGGLILTKHFNAILFGIALLLAFVATVLIMRVVQTHASQSQGSEKAVVLVAKSLPPGTQVTQSDVSTKQLPAAGLSPGAFTTPSQVVGQYTLTQWIPGQQVVNGMVGPPNKVKFSLQIPNGMRALTLADSSLIGVDHLIVPGDRVDILAGFSAKANSSNTIAKTILQDILVLYVDQQQHPGQVPSTGNSTTQSANNGPNSDTITLAVTPKQAEELVYIEAAQAALSLSLRNPEDGGIVSIPIQSQIP